MHIVLYDYNDKAATLLHIFKCHLKTQISFALSKTAYKKVFESNVQSKHNIYRPILKNRIQFYEK